jgi:hypothetical protein
LTQILSKNYSENSSVVDITKLFKLDVDSVIKDASNYKEDDEENDIDLFNLFQIDFDIFLQRKRMLMKRLYQQGSELESWPYYEWQIQSKAEEEEIEEHNKQNGKTNSNMEDYSASSLMKQAQSSMPKMQAPSIKIPKF